MTTGALALLGLVGAFHGSGCANGAARILPHAAVPTGAEVFPASCGLHLAASASASGSPSGRWYIRRRPVPPRTLPTSRRTHSRRESLTSGLTPQLARDWASIRSELRIAVPDSTFEIWLAPLTPRAFVDDRLIVAAPDEIRCWVADRFGRVLQSCAAHVLGPTIAVDVVAPDAPLELPSPQARHADDVPAIEQDFHPKLTFDQFVIGDSNRFAHAASLAVAELPGQAYNPLFLYGPPGLGKTHLLHAIGNYVRAHGGGLRVRFTTAERFTNEFVAALQARYVDDFKARFRAIDVLLIDDVQFLQRKAKTEEELFHTFNALYETGSQLVLTCDRLPADKAALEARLLERFQAGLVAELRPPDLPTRLAILRKRVQHDGIALADEGALHAIAQRITSNARALEGALIRVVAYHSLTQRPIDATLADDVLGGLYPRTQPRRQPATIERVQQLTCDAFGISHDELLSSARSARIAWPRQVAMYLARQHTGATLPAIGQAFGGRNHTTVMYACRRTADRIAADPEAHSVVRDLERRLLDADCRDRRT
ncbi:MAG: chromosomal replication initiator protein [Solirubrobacteraceae bacterium]|nr:chromosomal replication initiator protein [Solirubrobacteraceae bacterium]